MTYATSQPVGFAVPMGYGQPQAMNYPKPVNMAYQMGMFGQQAPPQGYGMPP